MISKDKKKIYIEEMKGFFSKTTSVFVTQYQGLTVKQIDEASKFSKLCCNVWSSYILCQLYCEHQTDQGQVKEHSLPILIEQQTGQLLPNLQTLRRQNQNHGRNQEEDAKLEIRD